MTRSDYVKILKLAAIKQITQTFISICVQKLPFLGFKLVNPIFGFIVGKAMQVLAEETEMAIYFSYVDFRTSEQCSEYEEAALEYHKNPTKENEKRLCDALDKFISLVV